MWRLDWRVPVTNLEVVTSKVEEPGISGSDMSFRKDNILLLLQFRGIWLFGAFSFAVAPQTRLKDTVRKEVFSLLILRDGIAFRLFCLLDL